MKKITIFLSGLSLGLMFVAGVVFADSRSVEYSNGNYLISTGGLHFQTTGAKPTCDVSNRGLVWITRSGIGVADLAEICQKTILDTYAWTALL